MQNGPSGAANCFRTLFLFRICVIFLRTVPARGSVRGVCVPSNRACFFLFVLHSSLFSNTTYPCLLSSSGSGPVELEHKAQFQSANEVFTLRVKITKHDLNINKNYAIFLQFGAHNISTIAQNRTQVVFSTQGFFSPHFSAPTSVILFWYLIFI